MLTLSVVVLVRQHFVQIKRYYGKTETFCSYCSYTGDPLDSIIPEGIFFNRFVASEVINFHSLLSAALSTLLRDGKGPFRGAASRYPVSWLVTSGAQGMHGIIVFLKNCNGFCLKLSIFE